MSYHKFTLRLLTALLSLMLIPSFGVMISSAEVVPLDDDDIQYLTWLEAQRDDLKESEVSLLPTRSGGGSLKWKITLEEVEGFALSTPTLADLNMDGTLEIVIASSGDAVYALNPNGTMFWPEPYTGLQIDPMDEVPYAHYGNQTPPPFFASPAIKDIHLGPTPEIIIGGVNAVVCLGSDGIPVWTHQSMNSTFFAPPTITDLEGNWTGNKSELEVILAADLNNDTYLIEAFSPNGSVIFREYYPYLYSTLGNIAGAVTAQDMDGDFWYGPYPTMPPENVERRTELLFGGTGDGFRTLEFNETRGRYELRDDGPQGGLRHYGSISVANVTGSPGCEAFIPSSEYSGDNWTSWSGKLYVCNEKGQKIWDYSTGSGGASIFTSPAIADIQMALLEPEARHLDHEVIFGADNGIMYVMNTEFHSVIWTFDTGGRCLSSPAICNIDNDDELEIVIGSDSGKIFCLDGDPSDGIDEGLPYPGDGYDQDVLWVYDTKTPIGISSPVVADIDLDGQLEVVIGDSEGTVWCFCVGGRSLVGQKDWVTSCGNDNRTGQYTLTKWYGVNLHPKIGPDGWPESLVRSIKPGETIVFNVTVENTGKGITEMNRDKIVVLLDQESIPYGWAAGLTLPSDHGIDNPDYVMLASGEKAPIRLDVTAPWVADFGEMVRINITAVSTGDPMAGDRCTCLAVWDSSLDFKLSYLKQASVDVLDPLVGHKWEKVDPGTSIDLPLSIRNKGFLNDTYEISLLPPPIEAGWNWSFVGTGTLHATVSLSAPIFQEFGAVHNTTLTVTVYCPEHAYASKIQPVTVIGSSVLSQGSEMDEVLKTDTLDLIVTEVVDIDAYAENDSIVLRSNETGSFDIWVWNNGNGLDLPVLMNLDDRGTGWDITYDAEPFHLTGSEAAHIRISVKHPGWASGISNLEFILQFEAMRGSSSVILHLEARIDPIYFVSVFMLTEMPIELEPGGVDSAVIEIWNNGPEKEVINLSSQRSGRITIDFLIEGEEVDNVTMDPWTSIYLLVGLSCETGAAAGPIFIDIVLSRLDQYHLFLPMEVLILNRSLIHIEMYTGEDSIDINSGPGEDHTFLTCVQNNGNRPEVVTLWVGERVIEYGDHIAIPYGWYGGFYGISRSAYGGMNGSIIRTDRVIEVSDLDDGWFGLNDNTNTSGTLAGYVDHFTILIDPGDTLWVRVVLMQIGNFTHSKFVYDFQMWAYHDGGLHPEILEASVYMFYPDLEVEDGFRLTSPLGLEIDKAVSGEEFNLVFEVMNIGNWVSPQTTVKVLIDGKLFGYVQLESINPGDSVELSIDLDLDSGGHLVQVEIDPENNVIESVDQFDIVGVDERTNRAVFDLTVYDPDPQAADRTDLMFIASVLLVLVFIVALVSIQKIFSRKGDQRELPREVVLDKHDILGDPGFKGREE